MLTRVKSMNKSQKAAWGLIGLVLSCGLCSRLGSDNPTIKTSPTPVVATDLPAATEPVSTEAPEPTLAPEPSATEAAPPTNAPTDIPPTAPPTPIPPTAAPQPAGLPAGVEERDPNIDANCADFSSPAAAQTWWAYHRAQGHSNPGGLDGDNDGDVCEQGNDGPSSGAQPDAPPPAAPSIACSGSKKCAEFGSQGEAQAYWEACGRPGDMDRDGDGRICESLP